MALSPFQGHDKHLPRVDTPDGGHTWMDMTSTCKLGCLRMELGEDKGVEHRREVPPGFQDEKGFESLQKGRAGKQFKPKGLFQF